MERSRKTVGCARAGGRIPLSIGLCVSVRRRDQKALRTVTITWRGAPASRVWDEPVGSLLEKPFEPMVET